MSFQTSLRTHTCGDLRKEHIGKKVTLCGWVHVRRDHGGVVFVDLRDRYGLTQVVFEPGFNEDTHREANELRREDAIQVKGVVRARKEGMANPNLTTGDIELFADEIHVLSKSETPPFEIDDEPPSNEELRLKYRYIDLRRRPMIRRLELRNKLANAVHEFMSQHGFLNIETPLLIKSTPEGARDYLVPSRVNPGKFYALPQSPQLYKQVCMIAGIDRYYQLARCLRDEDLRMDRQPEHTQIDIEMSFVKSKDVREYVESLLKHIVKSAKGIELKESFPVFTYDEAMERYGCDKPDIRFAIETMDVTDIAAKSDFQIFKQVIAEKGIIKVINPPKDFTRTELDAYGSFCVSNGAKGMAWMRVTDKGLEGNIVKYFSPEVQKELVERTGAKQGTVLMFSAGKPKHCNDVISRLRLKIGDDLGLKDANALAFCWVIDFPQYEWNEEEQKWDYMHNPFSMPKEEHLSFMEEHPEKVYADLYDVVLNGTELGSGAIRISRPDVQRRVMKIIGFTDEEAESKFGFLLEAYKYGGPPHGGIGLGFDRIVALMSGTSDIREVIAFPKNKAAQCPMDGSPSEVEQKQLKELHLQLNLPKKS